jgi:RNA polymerase sigma-70 factor (ECF subfamily)
MVANSPVPAGREEFTTTHWSLVASAGEANRAAAADALAELCERYWYPVYGYIRRRAASVHEAQDMTQAFFAYLLERGSVPRADPGRGRFRAFLLTACKRFLINEWHKGRAVKRGGGRCPLTLDFASGDSKLGLLAVDNVTPEHLYDHEWAVALLERVMERLQGEYAAKERLRHFEALKLFLAGSPRGSAYANAARTLGISEATVKVAAHRMRRRYRELLRAEIAQTVENPAEIDEEIRDLFAALRTEK